jgi:hypothetical protein
MAEAVGLAKMQPAQTLSTLSLKESNQKVVQISSQLQSIGFQLQNFLILRYEMLIKKWPSTHQAMDADSLLLKHKRTNQAESKQYLGAYD